MILLRNKSYYLKYGLFILLFTIIASEVMLRIYYKFLSPVGTYEELLSIKGYYENDETLGYDIIPNIMPRYHILRDSRYLIWSNELGCFDKCYEGEEDYILLVGDSFTWGFTPWQDKYGTIIEDILNYRVLKCGVNGYGTKQELLKIKKIIGKLNKKPNLVIVGYFLENDFCDDYLFPNCSVIDGFFARNVKVRDSLTYKKEIVPREEKEKKVNEITKQGDFDGLPSMPFPSLRQYLRKKSVLYCFLRDNFMRTIGWKIGLFHRDRDIFDSIRRIDIFYQRERLPQIEEAWNKHLDNIKKIKVLCDENNAQLLIVLIPSREWVYEFLKKRSNLVNYDLGAVNKELTEFFTRQNISYLDLTPLFRKYANQKPKLDLDSKEDLYWQRDGHWNVRGNKLAGLLISKYILENKLVGISNGEEKREDIEEKLKAFYK